MESWEYDTAALIEDLAQRNVTGRHPEGSSEFYSVDMCLLNLRPLSWLSLFALGLSCWVFIQQHEHKFRGKKYHDIFCDRRPGLVATVRWSWIVGMCAFLMCILLHLITAIATFDYFFSIFVLCFYMICVNWHMIEVSPYHALWHSGGNIVATVMLLIMAFCRSSTYRSWLGLREALSSLLAAAVESDKQGCSTSLHPDSLQPLLPLSLPRPPPPSCHQGTAQQ